MTIPSPDELAELEYLTVAQVAALEGCSESTILHRCRTGRYPGVLRVSPRGAWKIPNPGFTGQRWTPPNHPLRDRDRDRAIGDLAAALIAELHANGRAPARCAAVGVQLLHGLLTEHHRRADGDLCASCLWPYPCSTHEAAHRGLDAMLRVLEEAGL